MLLFFQIIVWTQIKKESGPNNSVSGTYFFLTFDFTFLNTNMKVILTFALLAMTVMAADKVVVRAFVESYCPDCIAFTANELRELTLLDDIMEITDLEIVPFGKARIVSRNPPIFECQHGDKECYGNKVELCSLAYYPTKGLNMMNCMQKVRKFDDETITECAHQEEVEAQPIIECANGVEANNLMIYAGDLTPKLTYVPSIQVNGELFTDAENIVKHICTAYTGELPASCKKSLRDYSVSFNK